MAIHTVKMPDLGEGITEVEVVAWHVQAGDMVAEDQLLADVMTDKATVEIPSPVAGKVARLGGEMGEVLAVGATLIEIATDGDGAAETAPVASTAAAAKPGRDTDDEPASPATLANVAGKAVTAKAIASPAAAPKALPAKPVAPASPTDRPTTSPAKPVAPASPSDRPTTSPAKPVAPASPDDRPIASPAVRRRAWELGVDLRQVRATGAGSRIMQADLDTHAEQHGAPGSAATAPAPSTTARTGEDIVQNIKVIGLRRRIAQKMQESKRRIPHFAYVEECDVTELESLRAQLNTRFGNNRGKLTLLPFLVRAMVLAIADFPQINALFDDDTGVITRHGAVHLGIATQTEAGLMVPVLRHAQDGDLWTNARAISRLAEMTRSGRATRDELTGSTITLTSLGALGGIVSTPIINAPEVAIVGVNRIVERPMVMAGAFVARKMMNLSSSFDHRVVDGQDAAMFIQAVRGLVESPGVLLAT